jgi:hypothetical protein
VSADEPIDVVASVGELDAVVVLLRDFLHRAGAVRAVAALEHDDGTAIVDCERLQPIAVTTGGRTVVLPHAIELDAAPLPVPEVTQLPAFEVNAARGEITSPLGGVEHYARAVRALSDALPGAHGVALVTWDTTDPDTPLSIGARGTEPLVLTLGDEEFELAPDAHR